MSVSHLLNTNVISRLMKDPNSVGARRLSALGDERICTCIVVASELRLGRRCAAPFGLLKPSSACPNDLLIAAQARCLGLTLVTENEREFRRVRELRVENWQV